MSISVKCVVIATVSTVVFGCGSSGSPAGNRPVNTVNESSVPAANASNVEPKPDINVNANGNIAQTDQANRRKPVDNPANGPKPSPQYRPSGENSETAITMDEQNRFVEVRVFHDHPQFDRIEAVWIGLPLKELRFKLRNGKVVTARTEKLQNLQSASTADLLEILAQASKAN